jgi:hypothetical protein
MKLLLIAFLSTFSIGSYSISLPNSDAFLLENTNIYSSTGLFASSTNDIGVLIDQFLSESKYGEYGVSFDLFKNNNRLIYRGECEDNYFCNYHFNYLYTGKLFINGKSLGSYVGERDWNIILRGPHAGAFVLEIVSDDGGVGDLHIDNMRKDIARSLSASLIKEYPSNNFHDYLYKNGKGYILFSYSWGASYFFFNLYASGNKNNLLDIISNH